MSISFLGCEDPTLQRHAVLRSVHTADIPPHERLLRDRSMYFLVKGLITSSQFSKKKKIGICPRGHAPGLPFCIAVQSFDKHSKYLSHIKSHCHHDTHTAMSDQVYIYKHEPQTCVERQAPSYLNLPTAFLDTNIRWYCTSYIYIYMDLYL